MTMRCGYALCHILAPMLFPVSHEETITGEATASEPQTCRRNRQRKARPQNQDGRGVIPAKGKGQCMTGDKKTGKDSPQGWNNPRATSRNGAINLEGFIREDDDQVLLKDGMRQINGRGEV